MKDKSEGHDSGNTAAERESGAAASPTNTATSTNRRTFCGMASGMAMAGGLLSSGGAFAYVAGRYLFTDSSDAVGWQFLATLEELKLGEALTYVTPAGAKVVVARQTEGNTEECFIALSSVCPHLGCAVHWEPQNDRFFCPCHNGAFDKTGSPLSGPPADANQQLTRFPLKVEGNRIFIEAPLNSITDGESAVVATAATSRALAKCQQIDQTKEA